jgi:ubiquinone/menaquinone biosynthesis C-methylase UbiE
MVWLFTLGRERAFREQILGFANLAPGEAVLDVGCGTGSLAIAAKRHVGPTGAVYGIDASPEMLARAGKKAVKIGLDVVFRNGAAQALPFADGQFDAVLSTLLLHHLPRTARQQCASEMRRVLNPADAHWWSTSQAPPITRTGSSRAFTAMATSSPVRSWLCSAKPA